MRINTAHLCCIAIFLYNSRSAALPHFPFTYTLYRFGFPHKWVVKPLPVSDSNSQMSENNKLSNHRRARFEKLQYKLSINIHMTKAIHRSTYMLRYCPKAAVKSQSCYPYEPHQQSQISAGTGLPFDDRAGWCRVHQRGLLNLPTVYTKTFV